MEQVQQIFVTDHIHELEIEAAALRAERARDVRATSRGTATGPRQRLGRWLIGVGEAVSGRTGDAAGDCGDPMTNPA